MKKTAAYVFAFSLAAAVFAGCGKTEEVSDPGSQTAEIPVVTAEYTEYVPVTQKFTTAETEPKGTDVSDTETAPEETETAEKPKKTDSEDDNVPSGEKKPSAPQKTERYVQQTRAEETAAEKPKTTKSESEEEPVVTQAPPEETEAPEPEPVVYAEPYYCGGVLIINKSHPVDEDYMPSDMVSDEDGDWLRTDTMAAFREMQDAAAEEGHKLWVQSGYRSYSTQKRLYEGYAARDGYAAADTYSARPGYSEHQTGEALDLNDISSSFAYTPEGQWVAEHCHEYGFIIRYPKGMEGTTGYMYEPWHLRYLGVDLATSVYNSGLCLEDYLGIDSYYRD